MFAGRRYITLFSLLLISTSVGWFFNHSLANSEETYRKMDRGLFYMKEVFRSVSRNYVDDLDPEKLSRAAIDGMLREFDPYTVFFEDPGSQQMRMITRGKYGGVGMEITVQDGKLTVITPMDSSPAQRAGIRAGDIVVEIDGVVATAMTLDDASQKLRGKVGTLITLKFRRPGIEDVIAVELLREEIVIKDVTYADFIAPGTAYIRLSAFSDKASTELREVISELVLRAPIERVILDLRGNPGGLLTAAVEVSNVFLPKGKLIVSTRGSNENENRFYTRESPLLPDQPLVVLVDNSSASASEIVAGAMQDLDRAVLVGTETFGKGLVQKVYPIDKLSQAYLKITTAKYFVPSGRSIQKEDYKKDNQMFTDGSDTLEFDNSVDYFTENGRVVHGGGGIQPDVSVLTDDNDQFIKNLSARGYFFRFAVDYLARNKKLTEAKSLNISDKVLQAFREYLLEHAFDYELEGTRELERFLEIASRNHYDTDMQDLVQVALQKVQMIKKAQFNDHHAELRRLLAAEFAEKFGGSSSRVRTTLAYDPQVQQSLKVLENIPRYREILAVAGGVGSRR